MAKVMKSLEGKAVSYYLYHYRVFSLVSEGVRELAHFYHLYHMMF